MFLNRFDRVLRTSRRKTAGFGQKRRNSGFVKLQRFDQNKLHHKFYSTNFIRGLDLRLERFRCSQEFFGRFRILRRERSVFENLRAVRAF